MWIVWFLTVILTLLLIKFIRLSLFWRGKGIPYEPYSCYLYRILWILNTRSHDEYMDYAKKRYGRLFGSYKGITPSLVSADVEIAKDVLIKQFRNFFRRSIDASYGEPIWDNNLLNLDYDDWRMMRNAWAHAFTSAKMKHMIAKFDVMAKRLTKKLAGLTESNGGHLDVELYKYAKLYCTDSIMLIALGKDANCIENPNSKVVKYTSVSPGSGMSYFLFMVAPGLFGHVPGVSFPPKETTDFFKSLADQALKEKRANLDKALADGTADIIDRQLLLQREEPRISDAYLTSQAFLIMVAGIDTSASAVSIALYYMALFPEAQRRAYNEVKSLVGDRKEVRHEDVQELKYLEGVLLESMRIFPLSEPIDRVCSEDTVVGGVPVNKGMIVEFYTKDMMRNPDYFPEPLEFQPERFMKTEFAQQQELAAFLQFGDGPKHCAGKRLAIMIAMTGLANLLLDFSLETCPKTPAHPPKLKANFEFGDLTQEPLVIRIKPRQ